MKNRIQQANLRPVKFEEIERFGLYENVLNNKTSTSTSMVVMSALLHYFTCVLQYSTGS